MLPIGILLLLCLAPGLLPTGRAAAEEGPGSGRAIRFIDVHNHLHGLHGVAGVVQHDFEGAARLALNRMNEVGIKRMYVLPPPIARGDRAGYEADDFIDTIRKWPDRFGFLAGGGSLNVMIQEAVQEGRMSDGMKEKFRKKALDLLSKGALGFSELTAEHFSLGPDHPYEGAPPDHPLFLLLADIAAEEGVPVDIHMEAIPEDMPLPESLSSWRNPKNLKANIPAFERLLSHNRNAKIIWAHVGWCQTGRRTPALCAELLEKHPNLYMSFKIGPDSRPEVRPLAKGTGLKPEWLDLVVKYTDRFLIGSDQFYVTPRANKRFPPHVEASRDLLSFFPQDVARKVAVENARKVFKRDKTE